MHKCLVRSESERNIPGSFDSIRSTLNEIWTESVSKYAPPMDCHDEETVAGVRLELANSWDMCMTLALISDGIVPVMTV